MKQLFQKIILVLVVAVVFAACKSKNGANNTMVLSAGDSAEYKEFVQWKKEKAEAAAVAAAKPQVIYKTRVVNAAPAATTAVKKKGWSNAAKGAVIGAGAGAVAGAIINKRNRAAGAAIGGVIGAGVGYGIGKAKDNKARRNG